jgi:hypothetical protein
MDDAIRTGLARDHGVHPYGKWRGAFWRLVSLVELVARADDPGVATDAAARGAEFLLRHRLVFSERTGKPAHPVFLELAYPPYWHYDALAGLTTLERSSGLDDPRAGDALGLLESKRLPDGSWRCERRWWKRPGSKGSGVEAVDWGSKAHELLTERASAILRAAGRG